MVTPAATAQLWPPGSGTHESAVAVPITAHPARRGRPATAGVRVARPRNPSIHHGREPCANGCTRPKTGGRAAGQAAGEDLGAGGGGAGGSRVVARIGRPKKSCRAGRWRRAPRHGRRREPAPGSGVGGRTHAVARVRKAPLPPAKRPVELGRQTISTGTSDRLTQAPAAGPDHRGGADACPPILASVDAEGRSLGALSTRFVSLAGTERTGSIDSKAHAPTRRQTAL